MPFGSALRTEQVRSLRIGISLNMAKYPVKSTSQSTYGRMERTCKGSDKQTRVAKYTYNNYPLIYKPVQNTDCYPSFIISVSHIFQVFLLRPNSL